MDQSSYEIKSYSHTLLLIIAASGQITSYCVSRIVCKTLVLLSQYMVYGEECVQREGAPPMPPVCFPFATSLLPLKRLCSLSSTGTVADNPQFGVYIVHIYIYKPKTLPWILARS
jgi:hypothetical protein